MNTLYPITREQFEQIKPILEEARQKTRPRTHDLYDVICAILYRQQAGITWRALPKVYPPWRTVHEYQAQWSMTKPDSTSPLERVYNVLKEIA